MEDAASTSQLGEFPQRAIARRYDVERSCIRCHERKVRCDRDKPCSNCIRSQIACRYPGPERTKRRSQRQPQAKTEQLGPRLARLERAIAALAQQGPSGEHDRPSHASSTNASEMNLNANEYGSPNGKGLLVTEGTSTRYMDESLFLQVLDKDSDLQSAVDSPASSEISVQHSSLGFDGLISKPQLTAGLSSLYPSRGQAMQLWQIYLNNVDVLLKVLHVPTIQPVIFAAINNPSEAPADVNALLFSICFAAITTLDTEQIEFIIGLSRQSAIEIYQRGLEISLHNASFLDSPTIKSLQAMAIYLMCSRQHNGSRSGSSWSLNGMLIRTAQWIGLHRDGAQFNISPLDCELRRRLWYEILGSDSRVAEDHALSSSGFSGFTDTKLPLNLDDRDIYPDMKEAPASKKGFTEMTMFLVAIEMNIALQRMFELSASVRTGKGKMSDLEEFLQSTKDRIQDQYLQHCDANIPIQKAALSLGRVILGKLEVVVRQQYHRGLSPEESAAHLKEETLLLACNTIDIGNDMRTDELLSNFRWLFSTYPQYLLLTYALWHLCVQPGAECADRAWRTIEFTFSLVDSPGFPSPGLKWNVMRKLREKALRIRSSHLSVNAGNFDSLPVVVQNEALDQPSSVLEPGDAMLWDIDSIWFPSLDSSDLWLMGQDNS